MGTRGILRAVVIAIALAPGALPVATGLAANLQAPFHYVSGQRSASDSGWVMTRPYIPVTTRLVIPSNAVKGATVAAFALRYVGYSYTLTGNSPESGFSCIGFVSYVYRSMGIPLPGDLDNALAYAPRVGFSTLQRGDILWFQNTVWPGLSHTGIYLGGGRFVHAAWFTRGVIVSSFHKDPVDGEYWASHYLGASRPWGGADTHPLSLPLAVQAIPNTPVLLVDAPAIRIHRWWSLRAPVQVVVEQATPLTVITSRGHWYRIMTPEGTTGWITAAQVARATRAWGSGHVARAFAHVRTSVQRSLVTGGGRHGTAHHVVRHRHSTVHALALTRARRQGGTPVAGRRTSSHPSASPRFSLRQRVVTSVRVRAQPSRHARVLQLALPGRKVQVLGVHGAWKRILLSGGYSGYVYGRYLR